MSEKINTTIEQEVNFTNLTPFNNYVALKVINLNTTNNDIFLQISKISDQYQSFWKMIVVAVPPILKDKNKDPIELSVGDTILITPQDKTKTYNHNNEEIYFVNVDAMICKIPGEK